jgi:hypothetical protein
MRLVQIDTPEVYFGTECYGLEASTLSERLPPWDTSTPGGESATDRVDPA